jgi:AGCS family alanine or glycine:cation symporter
MLGSVMSLQAVWTFADIANGLMAVPNLISLLALSGMVAAETRAFLWEGDLEREAEDGLAPPAPDADVPEAAR